VIASTGYPRATEQDAVDALVDEWLSGTLPDTYHTVSPHWLPNRIELINDWHQDKVTDIVKALLPHWVTFLAHNSRLATDATQVALSSITAFLADTHCPGAHSRPGRWGHSTGAKQLDQAVR
jgi:hypothetical protein